MKGLVIELQGLRWRFKQGVAEPNLWYLFEEEATEGNTQPKAVLLIYVDDLLICGPPELVRAIAEAIGNVWKISELDVVEPNHGTRFLGCEIEVNEARDTSLDSPEALCDGVDSAALHPRDGPCPYSLRQRVTDSYRG